MRRKTKWTLGILLSLVLLVGLMLGMSATALADNTGAYSSYLVTTDANANKSGEDLTALQVTFNEKPWYIIADESEAVNAGTVTLLAADWNCGVVNFDSSQIANTLAAYTAESGSFYGVKDAISATSNGKLYLLSKEVAESLPHNVLIMNSSGWWLQSPDDGTLTTVWVTGNGGITEAGGGLVVSNAFGIRPALTLDLSKVTFDAMTKTFSLTTYPVWVGGTQVTSANAGDIFSDGKAAYNAETATLTLNEYSYSGPGYKDAAICFDDSSGKDFTISVSGTNSLTSTATYGYAIRSTGSGKVSVVGSGNGAALNLTVPSTYDTGYAVSVKGKEAVFKDLSMQISGYLGIVVNGKNTAGDALTIDKCKITFDGTAIDQAIWVYNESGDGTISIKNGSNLSGKGAILCYGYGTASGDADVSIENSTVILSGCTSAPASGKSRHAMEVLSKCGDSTLTIDGSTVNVTASNGVLANGNGADGINVGAQETANEKGAAKVEIKNSSTVTATGCANGLNIFTWGDQTTNPYGTTLTVDSSTLTASATNNLNYSSQRQS